ncbi:Hemolysin-type calcium-binding repeat-containing protein [Epibacterium ulvae]|uniref:Hemolysin-type calcium-binding repeat-containing protein n=1 Tax=Epibacterium ulvae TaxID=1156985 RepID=A0A1G5R6Q4_9RHOB|nr:calcium-binding protein [Epibacterium ulvae]SCZ69717.1 Hemolysin-type calcium-binding repeat-containing protein [Epibacterium ulvae]
MAFIEGTEYDDNLEGTSSNDTIIGGEGWDTLRGGAGNDSLFGGDDNDTLIGSAGDDTLDGGVGWDWASYEDSAASVSANLAENTVTGSDIGTDVLVNIDNVLGSDQSDIIRSNANDNWLAGGAGADTLYGGAGSDILDFYFNDTGYGLEIDLARETVVDGSGAVDTFYDFEGVAGTSYSDLIRGDNGDNRLLGYSGDDRLYGLEGADSIRGHSGNDTLYGNRGNDTLRAGHGNDIVNGGRGKDVLYYRHGNDMLDGGRGQDELRFSDYIHETYDNELGGPDDFHELTVNLKTGQLSFVTGLALPYFFDDVNGSYHTHNTTLSSIEHIRATYETDDGFHELQLDLNAIGSAGKNTLIGGVGQDTLSGRNGDDFLWGGGGNDLLRGGNGNDRLSTSLGNDTLNGGNGADELRFDRAARELENGSSDIVINLNTGIGYATADRTGTESRIISIENITGTYETNGDLRELEVDLIATGTQGTNRLIGGAGNDQIRGLSGRDRLNGGNGNDRLRGQDGDDLIIGGRGRDLLWGDDGNDTFLFNGNWGQDRVKDFDIGTDTLLIRGADEASDFASFQDAAQQVGDNIVYDASDDGRNVIVIENTVLNNLSVDDFQFG